PLPNNGQGGLYVDWKFGTSPLSLDGGKCMVGAGGPTCLDGKPPGHDPLTDIRYLHNLLLYKSTHSGDTQFDAEISRYEAIVKSEFEGYTNVKEPFVYYEFGDLFSLTNDAWFDMQRKNMVSTWFANVYHPAVGTVYESDATTPGGFYPVSRTLEIGAAFI